MIAMAPDELFSNNKVEYQYSQRNITYFKILDIFRTRLRSSEDISFITGKEWVNKYAGKY